MKIFLIFLGLVVSFAPSAFAEQSFPLSSTNTSINRQLEQLYSEGKGGQAIAQFGNVIMEGRCFEKDSSIPRKSYFALKVEQLSTGPIQNPNIPVLKISALAQVVDSDPAEYLKLLGDVSSYLYPVGERESDFYFQYRNGEYTIFTVYTNKQVNWIIAQLPLNGSYCYYYQKLVMP